MDPVIVTDAEGNWRENQLGLRSGIRWDEIDRISGHKLDGITEIYTVLELDFEYG